MKADIEDWVKLIDAGVRYKEKYGNSKRWHTFREYGRGNFGGYNQNTSGILPYNVVYAMKRSLVPNVYFRNPYMNVSPRFKPGLHLHAKVVESIDNWLIGELDIKSTIKTMVQDAFYCNRAIAKIGYDGLLSGTQKSQGFGEQLASLLNTPISQLGKKGNERVEYNNNVKPGSPWAVRILPDFFIVPFGVRTLSDCPWVDHVVLRPTADVKNDPKYKNTKELEGTHIEMINKGMAASLYQEMTQDVDYVEIHEIRDFKRKEIKAFVPGYDKWIRPPEEDAMQIEGLPFVDFTFNEDTEYYWGPSDVQIMEPQQLEINEARTQAMLHRRVALIKFLYTENAIDPDELDKLFSEHVMPGIKVKGVPSEVALLLQPHIPADLTQWTDIIRSDVRELIGFGKQQMGEAPPGRRTATEMGIVQDAHALRMDERRDTVADALVLMMKKINQVIFKHWTTEKVAQVVGYDGAKYWIKYTASDLTGEYNHSVDVESMVPSTKRMRRQEIVELMAALGNNPRVNLDYLMKLLLREYEWIDAMQVLPEAQETMENPMGMNQFMGMQNKMASNPAQLGARARSNAQKVGSK